MTFEEYWAIGVQANPLLVSHDILHAIAEAAWNASAKEEREACAKVCEETANTHGWNYVSPSMGGEMAHKIRTRSNALGEGRERGILREASSGEAATSTDGLEGNGRSDAG